MPAITANTMKKKPAICSQSTCRVRKTEAKNAPRARSSAESTRPAVIRDPAAASIVGCGGTAAFYRAAEVRLILASCLIKMGIPRPCCETQWLRRASKWLGRQQNGFTLVAPAAKALAKDGSAAPAPATL